MSHFLDSDTQIAVLNCLVDGVSLRATSRITGASRNAITRTLMRVGEGCAALHDRMMRGLRCADIQLDEIWAFVHTKQKRLPDGYRGEFGDNYTFVALDRKSKLVPSFLVGKRDGWHTESFLLDLSARLAEGVRPLLSSDGFDAYPWAVEGAFGCAVDYGQVIKDYGPEDPGRGRYSPAAVIGVEARAVSGCPDLSRVSTSHVERQNLTMRMSMRRLTRLTNAFSKKLDNLKAAVALHFAHYNLVRVHESIRVTPAMEAGVTGRLWTMADLLHAACDPMAIEPPR